MRLRFIERLLGRDLDDGPHDPIAELNMRAAFRQEAAKREAVKASLASKARAWTAGEGVALLVVQGGTSTTVWLTPEEAECLGLRLEIESGSLIRGMQ